MSLHLKDRAGSGVSYMKDLRELDCYGINLRFASFIDEEVVPTTFLADARVDSSEIASSDNDSDSVVFTFLNAVPRERYTTIYPDRVDSIDAVYFSVVSHISSTMPVPT